MVEDEMGGGILLFNNQIPLHAQGSVIADGAVVFEGPSIVYCEFHGRGFTSSNLRGSCVELVNSPVMKAFFVGEIDPHFVAFFHADFFGVEVEHPAFYVEGFGLGDRSFPARLDVGVCLTRGRDCHLDVCAAGV